MKLLLWLFIFVALVYISYTITVAIRKSIRNRGAQELAKARFLARWEVFTDPDGSVILVGVRRVARAGKQVEVIETQVTERISCDLPNDEREMEVRIAKVDAQSLANTLND